MNVICTTTCPISEVDWEVRDAIKIVQELVKGKCGFVTPSGKKLRDCDLLIRVGCNMYNTTIEIRSRKYICDHYAYYCDGVFWIGCVRRMRAELI